MLRIDAVLRHFCWRAFYLQLATTMRWDGKHLIAMCMAIEVTVVLLCMSANVNKFGDFRIDAMVEDPVA